MKVYEYSKCSTCVKAIRFLKQKGLAFETVDITTQPPTLMELRRALEHLKNRGLEVKSLLNTSGIQYRELKIADKIKSGLTEEALLEILAENGKLIKRPLIIGKTETFVGFKETEWDSATLQSLAAE